ncbi:MAG: ribosomal protein L13e [Candidatus Korarchaeota archaeon]|nr:ribosomal protein L13e [Candidatus Korarchaeota archaeon]
MRSLSPLVLTSTRREKRKRLGRGFSLGELREAGISITEARRKGIPVDRRRKTVHPWNVEALKKLVPR